MGYEQYKTCPGCFKAELKGGACDVCGYRVNDRKNLLALPEHTILAGKYVIGKVIGIGGFGITYLALDLTLNKISAIKEYLPRDIAGREAGSKTIKAHTEKEDELYRYGLEKFIEEARTLAKFDHYNIVRVREVFQENGTCYIVMDYYEGMTLDEYMKARGGRLTEEETIGIMMPIMDGLKVVHREGILHRDIKPENIYITKEGRGILIDFGSARIAMGERSRSMTVVLTPGYAPYEQYQSKGEQGVWTDIYGIGATMYHMLTGEAPPDAVERRDRDEIIPLKRKNPSISENTYRAVMKALAVYHRGRQKSVQELQDMLTVELKDETSHQETKEVNNIVTSDDLHTAKKTNVSDKQLKNFFIVVMLVISFAFIYFGLEEYKKNEQKKAEQLRIEQERIEKQRLEQERFAKQLAEQERLERERAERKRIKQEEANRKTIAFQNCIESARGNVYKDIIEKCSYAIQLNPTSDKLYTVKAIAYFRLNSYQECIKEATIAISLNRDNADAFFIRGHAYEKLRYYREAKSNYEYASTLGHQEAYNRLLNLINFYR